MSTDEDLGKMLLNAQDEIKNIKNEIDLIQNPMKASDANDYKHMFDKIKEHLSKFENNIQGKVDNIISKAMVSKENTLNKLPLINPNETSVLKPEMLAESNLMGQHVRPYRSGGARSQNSAETRRENVYSMTSSHRSHLNMNLVNSLILKDRTAPHNVEVTVSNQLKPLSSLKFVERKRLPVPKKMYNGTGSQMPSTLNDKTMPPINISEKDVKGGLLGLVNKGILPRDVDMTDLFATSGGGPLALNRVRMYDYREQFVKTEISSVPAHIYTTKFDLKSLEQNMEASRSKPFEVTRQQASAHQYQLSLDNTATTGGIQLIPSKNEINLEKPTAKQYEEVVDVYSLHHFIVRKGKALVDTPEFQSYKRIFYPLWTKIDLLIKALEKFLGEHGVSVAIIDGKKLADLGKKSSIKYTLEDLIDCIVNQEDINKVVKITKNLFRGPNGKAIAATKIQALFRMYKARMTYKRVKVLIEKVCVIQRAAKTFLMYKNTKKRIGEKRENYQDKAKDLAKKFKDMWPFLKNKRKVEIHINSLNFDELQRLSMEKILQKQNIQISRIFAMKDPLVDVIYVAPFDVPNEMISYYSKVLELGGIENGASRFTILWPENHISFPSHFSTSKILIYSPRALKRIRQLIKGKYAYIVPGIPSTDDTELSAHLNIPLFSGEPQKSYFYSTKSGAKGIFNACEMPVPAGSFNIYDEKEFILTLTKLIAYNLEVETWIFKIDDEFNGRGHASYNVNKIKSLADLKRKATEPTEDLILKIHEIVSSTLPTKIKIAMPALHRNYQEYIQRFISKGGVIEAAPNCPSSQISSTSVSFMIDPIGDIKVLGSYDKFFSQEFVTAGCFYPQKSVPNINLAAICETVGKTLYSKGVFGYICIDLVTFPDPSGRNSEEEKANRLFWAVDLNCYMTSYHAATLFFEFLMKGDLDPVTGVYTIPKMFLGEKSRDNSEPSTESGLTEFEGERRCFMYCPFMYHPGLSSVQYKTFFHLCRLKSISYDLESKTGIAFLLLDSLQTGVLGTLTIGQYRRESVKLMLDSLNFIMEQAGQVNLKPLDGESRPDTMLVTDVLSKVRLIQKLFVKKQKKMNE